MRNLFSAAPLPAPLPARADWLDELKQALAQCDRLLDELQRDHPFGLDTAILTARVTTLRGEIMRLEQGLDDPAAIDPKWTNIFADQAQTPCGKSPPPPNSTI